MLWLLGCLQADPEPALPPPPPPEPPPPLLDPALSVGTVQLGDLSVQLDLGRWTVGTLDALLAEGQQIADPGARQLFYAERLVGTPFEYESQLELPPPGTLRVNLRSLDCTTFVITTLAMVGAEDVEQLIDRLRRLRFLAAPDEPISSDPETGNILDFAYDIFVARGTAEGFVADVTGAVAGGEPLITLSSRLTARRRTPDYDRHERLIVPKYTREDDRVTADFISRETFARMDRSRVQSGDVLVFSRIAPGAPVGTDVLVGHMAIAKTIDGEVYMLHATRDYVWRPEATADDPPHGSGVYYLDDPRKEQLGVAPATLWVSDRRGRKSVIDGQPYYGYDPEQLRPVHDYMVGAHIRGVKVLRPSEDKP